MLSKFLKAACFVCMVSVINKPVSAGSFMNGNDLYAYCQDKDGSYGSIFCHAYIIGAADIVLGIGERNETAYGYQACPTNGITEGQVTDIVILWLRKNPSARHYGASSLVASALYESFPCR